MAHIIILSEWQSMLDQLHVYSEAIENNHYHGAQANQATELQASVEGLIDDINNKFRTAIDTKIGELETFLGI